MYIIKIEQNRHECEEGKEPYTLMFSGRNFDIFTESVTLYRSDGTEKEMTLNKLDTVYIMDSAGNTLDKFTVK